MCWSAIDHTVSYSRLLTFWTGACYKESLPPYLPCKICQNLNMEPNDDIWLTIVKLQCEAKAESWGKICYLNYCVKMIHMEEASLTFPQCCGLNCETTPSLDCAAPRFSLCLVEIGSHLSQELSWERWIAVYCTLWFGIKYRNHPACQIKWCVCVYILSFPDTLSVIWAFSIVAYMPIMTDNSLISPRSVINNSLIKCYSVTEICGCWNTFNLHLKCCASE